MRVLIADKFEQSGRDGLVAAGCEVIDRPGLKDEALAAEVASSKPDVLVVRSTKVTEAILSAGALKLVVRAGAGYNTIDVAAASHRGIYVSNCPGKNSAAVAELAMGHLLSLDRRIPDNVIALRAGQWKKSAFSSAPGVLGRTLGLIGCGQIAREMIPRARGFGMRIIAWARNPKPELGIEFRQTPNEVAAEADFVSVHLALNSATRSLIDWPFFEAMRQGACFINTSRAEIVDRDAMVRAILEKGIRCGLDVFHGEPAGGSGEFNDDIAKDASVYGTHHIGASTDQAQEAIAAETVRIIREFKNSGQVPNAVNLARHTPATCTLVVRHLDRPGVLAAVLDALSTEHINVQEMENVIFEGGEAAVARINLEKSPSADMLDRIRAKNQNVIELSVLAR